MIEQNVLLTVAQNRFHNFFRPCLLFKGLPFHFVSQAPRWLLAGSGKLASLHFNTMGLCPSVAHLTQLPLLPQLTSAAPAFIEPCHCGKIIYLGPFCYASTAEAIVFCSQNLLCTFHRETSMLLSAYCILSFESCVASVAL